MKKEKKTSAEKKQEKILRKMNPDFKVNMKAKKTKLSLNTITTISIAVAICLVIVLNILVSVLVEKYPNIEIDLTSNKTYNLQDDTVEYLSQNTTDIDIYILRDKDTFLNALGGYGTAYFIQADKLIRKMAAVSDHISYEYIDTTANPTFTANYTNIDWNSTTQGYLILVDAGEGNYTTLTIEDCFTFDETYSSTYGAYYFTSTTIEQAISTAILSLTSGDIVNVKYVTDTGQEESYYSSLNTLLKQNAYGVESISINTEEIGDDTDILCFIAPTVDLSEAVVEKLENWLYNDGAYGKNIIYFAHYEDVDTPNLDTLLEQYGLKISDGIAFTTSSSYYYNSYYTFMTEYVDDAYTTTLKNSNVPVIADYSKGVEVVDENVASVLLNVPSSAGILPFDGAETVDDLDQYITADGADVAAIGTKSNGDGASSNIAVFGSANMVINYLSGTYCNNSNYIVNLCNTITNRGDMGITITSASADDGVIEAVNAATKNVYYVLFIGVIPGIIIIAGIIVFVRRRFR